MNPKLTPLVEALNDLSDDELCELVGAINDTERILIPNCFTLAHAEAECPGRFNMATFADFSRSVDLDWANEISEAFRECVLNWLDDSDEELRRPQVDHP